MKQILLFTLAILFTSSTVFAQGDECSNATVLTLENGASCTAGGSYTWTGATASTGHPAPNCASYSTGDVWFSFTIPSGSNQDIFITTSSSLDGGGALYSGSCATTLIACSDDDAGGLDPEISASDLAPGTYYFRFWDYDDGTSGDVDICVSGVLPPPPPATPAGNCADANPLCSSAIGQEYSANTTGTAETGNNYGCLSSQPRPSWFYLEVASPGDLELEINNPVDLDFALWGPFSDLNTALGTCGSLPAPVSCGFTASAMPEVASYAGASTGDVFILVITAYSSTPATFTVTEGAGMTATTNCDILTGTPCSAAITESTAPSNFAYCNQMSGSTTVGMDANSGSGYVYTFDAGANATVNAGVIFAEICGNYSAAANITSGDPTTNPNYTGFFVNDGFDYGAATADGLDPFSGCDYITLVPITHIDINGTTGAFITDPDCFATGTPFIIDFYPAITATYDCNAETLTVDGGSPDDVGFPIAGEYTVSGDMAGTTSGGQLTGVGITTDGTYNISVTDPYGCAQDITLTVSGCTPPVGPPPANNDCANAENLPVVVTDAAGCIPGGVAIDMAPATDSGLGYSTLCNLTGNLSGTGDLWYSITIPANGTAFVRTGQVSGSLADDTILETYETNCDGTEMECQDADNYTSGLEGTHEELEITGTPGDIVLVRVGLASGSTGNGEIYLCAYTREPTGCESASIVIPICTDQPVSFAAGINEEAAESANPNVNYGCLSQSPNPAWYYLEVATAGTLSFDVSNSNFNDVDWAAWGPFNNIAEINASCAAGTNAFASIPLDCDYTTASSGTIDLASVSVGEIYVVLVTNFSNTATDISFSTTAGSTASTDCGSFCGSALVELAPSGISTANAQCSEGAWTYYYNPAAPSDMLFAIEWAPDGTLSTANEAAMNAASIDIQVDNSMDSKSTATDASYTMARYWNVNTTAFDEAVNVKFFYDIPEETAVVNAAQSFSGGSYEGFVWFKTESGSYDPAVNNTPEGLVGVIELVAAGSGLENGVTYVQFNGLTSFSGGTGAAGAGSQGVILPIELISFSGKANGAVNTLEWITASEKNTQWMVVERSINGKDGWEAIDQIAAIGNTTSQQFYTLDDTRPLNLGYYRLKSIDFDGQFQLSNVISIRREFQGFEIANTSPNPTKSMLNVDVVSDNNAPTSVFVRDVTGRIIQQYQFETTVGNNTFAVDMSNYTNGVYFLTILNNTHQLIEKVVKN